MASPPDRARRPGQRTDVTATALLSALCLFAVARPDAAALRPAPDAPALTAELTSPHGSLILDTDQDETPCFMQAWTASRSRSVSIQVRDVTTGAVQTINLTSFPQAALHFSSDAPVGRCQRTDVTFSGSF